jgi:hypothetical protein
VSVKAIPLQAWTGPEGSRSWGSQISRQSALEGGKVFSPTHRPSLPREALLVLISVRGWVNSRARVRPEGLCQWKIPVAPSGMEPATFRLVVQCLNQLNYHVPHCVSVVCLIVATRSSGPPASQPVSGLTHLSVDLSFGWGCLHNMVVVREC